MDRLVSTTRLITAEMAESHFPGRTMAAIKHRATMRRHVLCIASEPRGPQSIPSPEASSKALVRAQLRAGQHLLDLPLARRLAATVGMNPAHVKAAQT